MTAPKGFSSQQAALNKLNGYTKDQSIDTSEFTTIQKTGSKQRAMNVANKVAVKKNVAPLTVEANSTTRIIKCTGHGIRKEDFIKFRDGLNVDMECPILSVPDADTLILAYDLLNTPLITDTFDFFRYSTEVSTATTGTTPSSMYIEVDGVETPISRDTVTPANSVPIPVELFGASGLINITAGDIDIHTSHAGVNYDSMRLGDGTTLVNVTLANELKVKDAALIKSDTDNVTIVSSALPTGAATEATLAAQSAKITACDTGDVVISSSALPTGAATEATLAAQSAKLPASLGQKIANESLSVTFASNQSTLPIANKGKNSVAMAFNDYSITSVTTAAYTELVASLALDVNELEVFDSSGEALILAVGAALSEVDQFYIIPGGNGKIPLFIASGSRISIKAKTNTASVGFITINFFS